MYIGNNAVGGMVIRNISLGRGMVALGVFMVTIYAITLWAFNDYLQASVVALCTGLGAFWLAALIQLREEEKGYSGIRVPVSTVTQKSEVDTVPFVGTAMVGELGLMLFLTPSLPAFFAWGAATTGTISIAWICPTNRLQSDSLNLIAFGTTIFFILAMPYWATTEG